MKTIEIKKEDSTRPIILIILLVMIVFAQVLFEMRPVEIHTVSAEKNELKQEMSNQPTILSPKPDQNPETGTLANFITARDKMTKQENEDNVNSENKYSIAKMNSYLVVEPEPGLEFEEVMSIAFVDEGFKESITETDFQLQAMKSEAVQKTESEVNLYAFEKLVNECLIAEKETPLQIENWMIDSKCWCSEYEEILPVALFK